ncbi:MAG: replication protein [Lachnospiraceae bacterium]|nr:replication protein [Lachnospiraceae bacterium]MDY3223820.1 replication protein [Lachnospiraceae bacterium]
MEKRRTRNYATVVYPESAPENWKALLQEQCVPALISPLHDRDTNTDGTQKKKHYHVMILFDGVKTIEQAREVFSVIGGVGTEAIKCVRAYARYLCHLDNPDKVRYSMEDVISCSGADYYTMVNLAADKYSAIGEMIEFCIQNNVISYAQLLLFAKENRSDWFRVLCDNGTLTMVQFLKSKYWENSKYKE